MKKLTFITIIISGLVVMCYYFISEYFIFLLGVLFIYFCFLIKKSNNLNELKTISGLMAISIAAILLKYHFEILSFVISFFITCVFILILRKEKFMEIINFFNK